MKSRIKVRDRSHLRLLVKEAMDAHGESVDLNHLDVSLVTSFVDLFSGFMRGFRGNISEWDVSNATSMVDMFSKNEYFQVDLSRWNVSKVAHFDGMLNLGKMMMDQCSVRYSRPLNLLFPCAYLFKHLLPDSFASQIESWLSNYTVTIQSGFTLLPGSK